METTDYSLEDVKAIVRELLKWDSVVCALYDSDAEDDKEYPFDGGKAKEILDHFSKKTA